MYIMEQVGAVSLVRGSARVDIHKGQMRAIRDAWNGQRNDCRLRVSSHTKLFTSFDVSQRSIGNDFVLYIPYPAHVLMLRGMVEHGAETKDYSLTSDLIPMSISDRPITVTVRFVHIPAILMSDALCVVV